MRFIETTLRLGIFASIFLLLLMPFIISKDTIFPYTIGKALYSRSLIEVSFGMWLLLIWVSPKYMPPRSFVLWSLLACLVVAIFASIVGVSTTKSLWSNFERMGGVVDLAHWTALVVVVASVLRTVNHWRPFIVAAVLSGGVMAILGLAQYYYDPFPNYLPLIRERELRISGTLANPTFLGSYLVVIFFLALAVFGDSIAARRLQVSSVIGSTRRHKSRTSPRNDLEWLPLVPPWLLGATCIAIAGLILWAILLSGTRSAILALAIGLFTTAFSYLIWGHVRAFKPMIAFCLLAIVGLAVAAFLVMDTTAFADIKRSNPTFQRLASGGNSFGLDEGRKAAYQAGGKAFLKRPILGWGPENFLVAFEQHAPAKYFTITGEHGQSDFQDRAHNKLVEELATKGILGLGTYAALWIFLIWVLVLKIKNRPQEELFFFGVTGALIGYFSLSIFIFDAPSVLLLFMLIVGLIATTEGELGNTGITVHTLRLSLLWNRTVATKENSESSLERDRSPRSQPLLNILTSETKERLQTLRAKPNELLAYTIMIAILVFAGVGFLVYWFNYRPYQAATIIQPIYANLDLRSLTWYHRAARAEQSFATFPPLANVNRWLFFDDTSRYWETINQELQPSIFRFAGEQLEEAIRLEPQNLRLRLSVIRLYQAARLQHPRALEVSRQQLDIANTLSPHRKLILDLQDAQDQFEEEFNGFSQPSEE